jgi:hypothetical protein
MAVRVADSRTHTLTDAHLGQQEIGVFLDLESRANLALSPSDDLLSLSVEPPAMQWSIEAQPGPVSFARFALSV